MTRRLPQQDWAIRFLSIGSLLFAPILAQSQDTVSTPSVPDGPTSGLSGTLYMYSASGSTSSLGNPVQYSFNWGDGSYSGWTPNGVTFSFHTWSTPGTYSVTVQARSTVNPSVPSSVSPGLAVTIAGESISIPATASGPATAVTGTASAYSIAGAVSSLGHQVQYMLFWGDGSNSPWLPVGTTSASHTWPGPGTYSVTAQARCATDTQVLSAISPGLRVRDDSWRFMYVRAALTNSTAMPA